MGVRSLPLVSPTRLTHSPSRPPGTLSFPSPNSVTASGNLVAQAAAASHTAVQVGGPAVYLCCPHSEACGLHSHTPHWPQEPWPTYPETSRKGALFCTMISRPFTVDTLCVPMSASASKWVDIMRCITSEVLNVWPMSAKTPRLHEEGSARKAGRESVQRQSG